MSPACLMRSPASAAALQNEGAGGAANFEVDDATVEDAKDEDAKVDGSKAEEARAEEARGEEELRVGPDGVQQHEEEHNAEEIRQPGQRVEPEVVEEAKHPHVQPVW